MNSSNPNDKDENRMGEPAPENPWTSDKIRKLNALRRRLDELERKDEELKQRLKDLEDQYVEIRMKSLMRDLDKLLRGE